MQGFDDWLERYAAVFGLNYPAGLTMLASWEVHFDRDGVTAAELDAALLHLATRDAPASTWDHLPKLQAFLRSTRAESREHERRLRDEGFEDHRCAICAGTGYAVVPHLRCVEGSQWLPRGGVWYTHAVTCDCKRGEAIYEGCVEGRRKNGPPLPLSLREYHRRNAKWQQQLSQRAQQQAQERESRRLAEVADLARRGLGPPPISAALERIRCRIRQPGEEG